MRRLLDLIRLVRLHNVAAAVLSVAVGYGIASNGMASWILLAGVATATAGGYVINDIEDRDIDMINKPFRPLPSGAVTPRAAWALYLFCVIATCISTMWLSLVQTIWLGSWVILLHLYSVMLKRIYLAGNILVALVSASGLLLGAHAGGNIWAGAVPALLAFFFSIGRELVKDTEDIAGDKACGARTVPIVFGKIGTLRISSLIFWALIIAFQLPWIIGGYGAFYAVIVASTVVPILAVSAWLSWRGRSLGRVSGLLKLGMFCGILAFYFGPRGL